MRKLFPVLILFLLAMLIWNLAVGHNDLSVLFDGDEIDGPVGALAALLFAGGGVLIAGVVMLFVGVVLAVAFAGVGILVVAALGLAAVVVALAVSPLLLPILLPLAVVWYLVSRSRRNRSKAETVGGAAPRG